MTPAEVVGILRDPACLEQVAAQHGDAAVIAELRREGVAPYVAWLRPDWTPLADDRRRAALQAATQHHELQRVCAALVAGGVTPLVLKGAAWAVTHYPEPWCRPHLDLDLLVDPSSRGQAFATLERLGYTRAGRIPGQLVNAQEVFERRLGPGSLVVVDLHWQVSNRIRLAQFLPTRALLSRGQPAPAIGPGVLQAAPQDALLLACLHPFAHHAQTAPLKWVVDVLRLSQALGGPQTAEMLAQAKAGGVDLLVLRALADAAELTANPSHVPALAIAMGRPASAQDDPWFNWQRSELNDVIDDFRALSSWRARVRLLKEHLLPPPWFMAHQYGASARGWRLPLAYVHRLSTGGLRWVAQWWNTANRSAE